MTSILSQLRPKRGSTKPKKRVGRGSGSGLGTYSGKGLKGQKARKGKKLHSWFEGGQTSFLQKIPKLKGFKNPNRIEYRAINISDLNNSFKDNEEVNAKTLFEKKLISNAKTPFKILGTGDLSKALIVQTDKISSIAIKKIEEANGKVEILTRKVAKKRENK